MPVSKLWGSILPPEQGPPHLGSGVFHYALYEEAIANLSNNSPSLPREGRGQMGESSQIQRKLSMISNLIFIHIYESTTRNHQKF